MVRRRYLETVVGVDSTQHRTRKISYSVRYPVVEAESGSESPKLMCRLIAYRFSMSMLLCLMMAQIARYLVFASKHDV